MLRYLQQAWLVLTLALAFGLGLAAVSNKLGPIIEQNQRDAREAAALEVVPGGASAKLEEVAVGDEVLSVYRVFDAAGRQIGWAAPGQAMGYADRIELIFGLTADAGRITGMQVIYNQETPGLGNKITTEAFCGQFEGRAVNVPLVASKKFSGLAEYEIQAITGATISSEAVCTAINNRMSAELIEALSAAAEGEGR